MRRRHVLVALMLVAPFMGTVLGAADVATFQSKQWGLTVRYPADLVTSTIFKTNYFDRGAWRISYAADTGPGTRILALSLPDLKVTDAGGDSTATAELRIGASRDQAAVDTCLSYGTNSGNNAETRQRKLGAVTFTEVPDNSDGEMSREIKTDDLRAVYKGACYAIDLVLFTEGTSDRRPEFTPAQVGRLRDVLDTITFE